MVTANLRCTPDKSLVRQKPLGVFGGLFLGLAVTLVSMGLLAPVALPVGVIAGVLVGGAIGAGIGASIPASDLPDRWEYTPECWNGYYHTYCW
ncbi:hypothetical protein APR08_004403 [Nocardia amikacinitolerans]|nr:hypothetical protein [Nocardia amikacinitolerans]